MRYEENPGGGEKILLFGALAVGAWFVWTTFFNAGTPAAAAPAATPTPTPAPGAATPPAAAASTWTLASLYAAMIAAMKAANDPAVTIGSDGTITASPDVFDYYLQHVANSPVASGPPVAFQDHGTPITSTAFWAGMAPLLTSSIGLSGGAFFGGLGDLCAAMGGRR